MMQRLRTGAAGAHLYASEISEACYPLAARLGVFCRQGRPTRQHPFGGSNFFANS